MNGKLWIGAITVVLLATGAFAFRPGGWLRTKSEVNLEGVPVRRGELRITEVVSGNLAAKNSLSLRSELEGRTTVLSLIDEGTVVEAGDLICELDTSELQDDLVVQKISEQNSAADFTKAREQFEIQKIQNTSDIAEAELMLEFARLDLEKYTIDDGEWVHEQKKAEEAIKLKEEEQKRAEAQLEWTQKLFDQGFAQGTELEADQAQVARVTVEVEQARRDLALKLNYGHQRALAELQAEVETRERDLEKVRKQAEARLADFLAAKNSAEIRWDLEKEKLRKIEEQIAKGEVRAPDRGMVIYARERSRWGQGEPVQEGAEVRERQELVTIPREGGMIVEASLHETVLDKVQLGQLCSIQVDALPALSFTGRVAYVAVLPDANAWYANPNQRVYKAEIAIENAVRDLRPGMSASVEILVAELEDVHYVPVQSIFLDGGETIAFVKLDGRVETREVEVGLDDGKLVEVKSGLEEGELVLLSAPAGFEPRPGTEQEGPRGAEGPTEKSPRGERPQARGGGGEGSEGRETMQAGGRPKSSPGAADGGAKAAQPGSGPPDAQGAEAPATAGRPARPGAEGERPGEGAARTRPRRQGGGSRRAGEDRE